MNKLDTALVESAMLDAGFSLTGAVKEADVVLINTCSVRDHAEQRVISHLGHLKHLKEKRPELIVGVIGCMAQRLGDELFENNAVDIVCGPGQIAQIPKLVERAFTEKKKQIAVSQKIRQPDKELDESLEDFESVYGIKDKQIPAQAYVRIGRGCNKFCSYCIVPYVRGPEIYRAPKAIINQIKKLAEQGIKQVTLLGQTVNSYKYQEGAKTYSLADLLLGASEIEGIEWIKFVTSFPQEQFFVDIMQVMAESEKICNYLHIPAQSGSDKILKAMNRKYTAQQYLQLIETARDIVPDIGIASDFIVGFPGETNEDFQQTIELVKKAQYRNCFIFKYSPRPGTSSDKKLADSVPEEIKQQRNVELLAIQEQISEKLNRPLLGTTEKVLVEGPSKKPHINTDKNNQPQLISRTSTDQIVVFNGPLSLAGNFVNVHINKTSPLTLFGELDK